MYDRMQMYSTHHTYSHIDKGIQHLPNEPQAGNKLKYETSSSESMTIKEYLLLAYHAFNLTGLSFL